MIGVALFFDALGGLFAPTLFLPTLVNVVATLTFFIWLKLHGIKFTRGKAAGFGGTFLVESIPLVNALPFWTLTIATIAFKSKVKQVI
ncbi:hypothetical protein KW785_02835 [Candidatus Parcubacteria bacterium]|nr:hypothetical protein [Candidatus Parcubacteria bacterium]